MFTSGGRHCVAIGHPGNIVNIASTGAFAAQELVSVYCASKAALVALGRSMALELAAHNIRVNTVAPGDIFTEASAEAVEGVMLDEHRSDGEAYRLTSDMP